MIYPLLDLHQLDLPFLRLGAGWMLVPFQDGHLVLLRQGKPTRLSASIMMFRSDVVRQELHPDDRFVWEN